MSPKTANCPNCGAPIKFRWSSAIQTTCEFCRSILVRRDVNLEKVGEVADLPQDSSPIQLGAEGVWRKRPFTVVGRILYEYEQGGWNEWHIVFGDGTSAWLSDAQDDYALSVLEAHGALPPADQISVGQMFQFGSGRFQVTVITVARYKGVEGELPFEYWDHREVTFVDLRTPDARFATIDYSDNPPLLFLGEAVEFEDLQMKGLRQFEGWS
jgi:hypothetical protein